MPPIPPTIARARGQAVVELVIALPVLLLLILGLVTIGQYLLANYTVHQAARAAAHQAALAGGDAEAAHQAADQVIAAGVGTRPEHAEVAVRCRRSPCRRYDPITVAVTYAGRFWTPLPGFTTFTVAAEATRAAERDQQR